MDAAVAGGGVPVDLDHGHRPLPAGRELVLEGAQLLHGEVGQERRVVEPDGAVVLPGEEVAQHLAAAGLVGLDTDEPCDGGGARNPLLGQQPLHLPGGGPVSLPRDLLPGRHLAGVVGGDGEGLQHFQVDLVGAVGVEQVRRHVAEAEALLDQPLGGAEARRDHGDGEAGVGQLRERDHLVGRMPWRCGRRSPPATARPPYPDRRRPGRAPGGRDRSCRPRPVPSWPRGGGRRRPRPRRRHRRGRRCGRPGSPAGHGRRWRPSSRPRRRDRPASCARSRAQAPAGRAEPPGSAVRAGVRCDSCESPSIWAGNGWNGCGGDGLSGRPAPAPARPGSASMRGSGGDGRRSRDGGGRWPGGRPCCGNPDRAAFPATTGLGRRRFGRG